MKEDARAAAEAIIDYHKVQGQSCCMRTKTAFSCAPGMGVLIIVVALTELFTNTLLLMFDVVSNRSMVYMVMVLATPPRLAIFVWASWRINKKNWWRYWITIDNVLMLTVVISIVYGYMLLKLPKEDVKVSGAMDWRIAAVASFPMLMVAFNGNFRILVKMYPWTPLTILLYKSLRIYAVVLGTVTELVLRGKAVPGMDPGLVILYVSSQASYHVSLLAKIPSWTAWQRNIEAKAQAAQATGVPLTLDDSAHARRTGLQPATLAAGYASYDEENDQAVQYFQALGESRALSPTLHNYTLPVKINSDTPLLLSSEQDLDDDAPPPAYQP